MSKKMGIFTIVLAMLSILCSLFTLGFCLKLHVIDADKAKKNQETAEEVNTQYVMYVGTNDKDTYKMEMTEEEAREIVDSICLKYMRGYTLDEATGSWVDENNVRTHEYTLVCYFDDPEVEDVYAAADEIIKALNQNTILIEKNQVTMEYYGSDEY